MVEKRIINRSLNKDIFITSHLFFNHGYNIFLITQVYKNIKLNNKPPMLSLSVRNLGEKFSRESVSDLRLAILLQNIGKFKNIYSIFFLKSHLIHRYYQKLIPQKQKDRLFERRHTFLKESKAFINRWSFFILSLHSFQINLI